MHDDLERAVECFERGEVDPAEQLCRQVIATSPGGAAARVLLGRILVARGQADGAQSEFNAALQADPAHVDAWLQWGLLLQTLGHPQKAVECLALGLTYSPNAFPLLNALARVLLHMGNLEEAARQARRAIDVSAQAAAPWLTLGLVLGKQGQSAAAIAALSKATSLDPTLAEAHNFVGELLTGTDPTAAEQAFRAALRHRPDYAEALDSLGVIAVLRGNFAKALAHFDRALSINPPLLRALGHKTTTLFLMGNLSEAWPLYRRRFEVEGLKRDPHGRFPQAVWSGESLQGKRLLVWTELGLGEEVMQASMLPDASAAASRLTVECSPRLEALFRRSFPQAVVVPRTNPARACAVPIDADIQIAGGDLGAAFRGGWSAFPKHTGYLKADPAKVERLRAKYKGDAKALVVGLSWASKQSRFDKNKTLALLAFALILRQKGVVFVNLQYAADAEEIADVRAALGVDIISDDTIDPAGDMDDVAAQIAAMDLVICVSNSAAHIAGALNVPVWNIIPGHNTSGMWHWFHNLQGSPWYPSMKIYRRTEGTTESLMTRLAHDLQAAQTASVTARRI